MNDKEKVIEKIKKCLKLGTQSGVSGEAENAMAAAMKLAAGIGMEIGDICCDEEEEKVGHKIEEEGICKPRTTVPRWEGTLARGIGEALGCYVIIRSSPIGQYLVSIGSKADNILFQWLFGYVVQQLRKLCKQDRERLFSSLYRDCCESKLKRWEKGWYSGAAVRVCKEAKERFKQQTTVEEQEQYALVIIDKKKAVKEYVGTLQLQPAKQSRESLDQRAMTQGYETAGKVSFNKPISNSAPVGLDGN